jgi:hypothetical protein
MARTKGTYSLPANIETNAAAPLDARSVVVQKSDLTASGSFPYPYIGMQVYVRSEEKRYTLIADDPTVLANWHEDTAGGGAVDSVNGKIGEVVLDAEDVGALPDDTPLFSGSYNDLTDKPTIPDDLADLNDDSTHRLVTDTEKSTWNAKSDFSGSYTDLTDKPTIPDAQIQSDWNQNDNTKADYIKNKPSIPSAQVQSDWNESDSSKADFIKNKPSIPTALADLTDDSTHRTVTDTEKTAWNSGEANVQSNWNETDTASDAYIQNKPSIPSVTANPGSTTATLSSIGIDGTNYAISGGSSGGSTSRIPDDITDRIENLLTAIEEQDLEKYGYKIGDYFFGSSQASNNCKYWLADMDTFYAYDGGYSTEGVLLNTHHLAVVVETFEKSEYENSYSSMSGHKYDDTTLYNALTIATNTKIKPDFVNLFGGESGNEHLLSRYIIEGTGDSSSGTYKSGLPVICCALTEAQILGIRNYTNYEAQTGEGWKQLELFKKYGVGILKPDFHLRTIYNSTYSHYIRNRGICGYSSISTSRYVVGMILLGTRQS